MQQRASHRDTRKSSNASAVSSTFEALETRRLLSGVFEASKIPVFTPSSSDISDLKNGPFGNAGGNLAAIYSDYKKFIKRGGTPSEYVATSQLIQTRGNQVAVSMRTRGAISDLVTAVRQSGGSLIYKQNAYRIVQAYVPVSQLTTLLSNKSVAVMQPIYKPHVYGVDGVEGAGNNQAFYGHNADALAAAFNLDGSGVKVGVLSDSVNAFGGGLSDSIDSGDLLDNVEIISDNPFGSDEGRAMLELIHDIAPGADLAFASASGGQLVMADGIGALRDAGAKVIVDDIGYPAEPFFQEGVISNAITDITASGSIYLASAGNSSGSGYESPARWVRGADGRLMMDFDARAGGTDTRMSMTVADAVATLELQWDNPYNGVAGAATADLDIIVYDTLFGGVVASAGLDDNLSTTIPVDFARLIPPGEYEIEIVVSQLADGADLPTIVRFSDRFANSITSLEYQGTSQPATGGHNAGQDTISIAAAPFFESSAFGNVGNIDNEDFSAEGPVTYVFKANGERRDKNLTLMRPDVTGIDNVNTSFFGAGGGVDVKQDPDTLPNFSGTSAAAPNVAAVVALLCQLEPGLTSAQARDALIQSALNTPTNGQSAGQWHPNGGYGLVDALEAAKVLRPDLPVGQIEDVVPFDRAGAVESMTITFSEQVIGLQLSDFTLTRSGGSNLLTGSETLSTDDNITYTLSGLSALTSRRGTYNLTLAPAAAFDLDNNNTTGASQLFFVSGKPSKFILTPVTSTQIDLSWIDNATDETGYRVYRAENEQFTTNLKTYSLAANKTSFKNTGLVPGTRYFYKVKAIVAPGSSPSPSSDVASAFTLTPNEVILDNNSSGTSVNGTWSTNTDAETMFGVDFLNGSNLGNRSVTFTPNLKADGQYYVYARWVPGTNRASNVPFEIVDGNNVSQVVRKSQRSASGWVKLGTYFFKSTNGTVTVSNAGVDGRVIADAVRFVKLENAGAAGGSGSSGGSNNNDDDDDDNGGVLF